MITNILKDIIIHQLYPILYIKKISCTADYCSNYRDYLVLITKSISFSCIVFKKFPNYNNSSFLKNGRFFSKKLKKNSISKNIFLKNILLYLIF